MSTHKLEKYFEEMKVIFYSGCTPLERLAMVHKLKREMYVEGGTFIDVKALTQRVINLDSNRNQPIFRSMGVAWMEDNA